MNIPENTLQAVADAAFAQSPSNPMSCVVAGAAWKYQEQSRRAVIQHALNNPALAPFLSGGIGEYTDEEIKTAWTETVVWHGEARSFEDRLRAFLAALPRRESPALAEATPPAQPAPAAQVPLGPEDVPPGSALRSSKGYWFSAIHVSSTGVMLVTSNASRFITWNELDGEGWRINTSIAFGRWDANAWRPCSKPGKEVAK